MNDKVPLEDSELNRLIAPEISHDEFYSLIESVAAAEPLDHVLEIGSSSGGGSTQAFVSGLSRNAGTPKLYCIEVSKPRFEALQETYKDRRFVHCYNRSTVGVDEFPSPDAITDFYHNYDSTLRQYELDTVLGWLRQDIQYVRDAGVAADAIEQIKSDHAIDVFDLVLIDGSEFTGEIEFNKIYGARIILLDDINGYKTFKVRERLLADPDYERFAENKTLRSGYSAFRRRDRSVRQSDGTVAKRPTTNLPIHFFTIVLNGEPFIRYHEWMLSRLSIPWHWHVIEGVAALKHDSAWSVPTGGGIPHDLHNRGRSIDGTSEYLDDLASRFPDNVTIYRKPLDEFWDGKREMVTAPLSRITEPCLLWQVDSDELWSAEQVAAVHRAFIEMPARTAAFYWCWYFVGPDKIVTNRGHYGNPRTGAWLRTWRFKPGDTWRSHAPPVLVRKLKGSGEPVDVAEIAPFDHDEMESIGAVFQHFAYATEGQVTFKEKYYGYPDALAQWTRLQRQPGSGFLRPYLSWIPDAAKFGDARLPVDRLAWKDPATNEWVFKRDDPPAEPPRRSFLDRVRRLWRRIPGAPQADRIGTQNPAARQSARNNTAKDGLDPAAWSLPIQFFTIVQNGEPFIRHHERVLRRLPFRWHWHVVEGVAALRHDTAWSVAGGGRIPDELHDRGRSIDGTSEYLDELAARHPESVTIYRKPLGEFWDGKREMVSAPLSAISEPCLLWQLDSDELWTLEQIRAVHRAFLDDPRRTAAYYWCWYFVGPDKIVSTRLNYGNPRVEAWLRTWRFQPGDYWLRHEPPMLARVAPDRPDPVDVAGIAPFDHDEMEAIGAVFQHFAYVTPEQLAFKEKYYGYKDALAQWIKLQQHEGPGLLRNYLAWVPDDAQFDDARVLGIEPLMRRDIDAQSGAWMFRDNNTFQAT